jgi:DNA-binding XRE family transcriptional regulator
MKQPMYLKRVSDGALLKRNSDKTYSFETSKLSGRKFPFQSLMAMGGFEPVAEEKDRQALLLERIRQARKERGLKAAELAEIMGVNRTYVSTMMNSTRNLTLATIIKFEDALGIKLLNI